MLARGPVQDAEIRRRRVHKCLDTVMEAAAQFHGFESRQNVQNVCDLDRFLARVDLFPVIKDSWTPEITKLWQLRETCWSILDLILGFVYNLKSETPEDYRIVKPEKKIKFSVAAVPPSLPEWRRSRMIERSRRILGDLTLWDKMRDSVQNSLHYFIFCVDYHRSAALLVERAVSVSNLLYSQQRENLDRSSLHKITIKTVSIEKLPLQRFRAPSPVFRIVIDGKREEHTWSKILERTTQPVWPSEIDCNVTRGSRIRLEFYDSKVYDFGKGHDHKSRTGLIGSFQFKIADVITTGSSSRDKSSKPTIG